jgi:hypothetical protein
MNIKLPKLNTTIANVYQTQQRLTGLFVSAGSMLAILLELLLVVAGFTFAVVGGHQNPMTIALFAVIGALMAALVTKMTLTNAAKLRASLDRENDLRQDYKERSKGETVPADVKAELDQDIKEAGRGRWWIYILIGFGVLISIVCEKFAIDLLFKSVENWYLSNGLSVFLSCLVSCTVVSGELHKKRDAELIKDSLKHDSFLRLAAEANVYDSFNHKMIDAASTHVEQVLDQAVLGAYAQSLVYQSIETSTGTQNFAAQVDAIRSQQLQLARIREDQKHRLLAKVRGENEPQTDPIKPIQLHSLDEIETRFEGGTEGINEEIVPIQLHGLDEPTEPFQGEKTEGENGDRYASDYASQVELLYRENPAVTPTQIAKSLGCSYGTAKKWLERVKPSKPNNAS